MGTFEAGSKKKQRRARKLGAAALMRIWPDFFQLAALNQPDELVPLGGDKRTALLRSPIVMPWFVISTSGQAVQAGHNVNFLGISLIPPVVPRNRTGLLEI
jgi:hypothetical protein